MTQERVYPQLPEIADVHAARDVREQALTAPDAVYDAATERCHQTEMAFRHAEERRFLAEWDEAVSTWQAGAEAGA